MNRKVRLLLHIFGFCSMGGAVFFQILGFADIIQQGYFRAVEQNPVVLVFETLAVGYALIYFLYLYQRFLKNLCT